MNNQSLTQFNPIHSTDQCTNSCIPNNDLNFLLNEFENISSELLSVSKFLEEIKVSILNKNKKINYLEKENSKLKEKLYNKKERSHDKNASNFDDISRKADELSLIFKKTQFLISEIDKVL